MPGSILVIDQGTTSTRAIVFGPDALPIATAQEEFPQFYLQSGWVEHDPKDLWRTAVSTARIVLARAADRGSDGRGDGHRQPARNGAGLGPEHRPADPSRDRVAGSANRGGVARTCAPMVRRPWFRLEPACVLDPYFSATKIAWLLDNVPGARARAERGRTRLRHGRHVPAVAADGWRRPCDRRHQRVAHRAVRHSPRPLGSGPAEAVPRPEKHAARREGYARPSSARRPRRIWEPLCPSAASSATSRQPWSVRPASSQAW